MAELLRGACDRKYSTGMFEPCDRHQREASAASAEELLSVLPPVENTSVAREGCSNPTISAASRGGKNRSNPRSRRTPSSVRKSGRLVLLVWNRSAATLDGFHSRM